MKAFTKRKITRGQIRYKYMMDVIFKGKELKFRPRYEFGQSAILTNDNTLVTNQISECCIGNEYKNYIVTTFNEIIFVGQEYKQPLQQFVVSNNISLCPNRFYDVWEDLAYILNNAKNMLVWNKLKKAGYTREEATAIASQYKAFLTNTDSIGEMDIYHLLKLIGNRFAYEDIMLISVKAHKKYYS